LLHDLQQTAIFATINRLKEPLQDAINQYDMINHIIDQVDHILQSAGFNVIRFCLILTNREMFAGDFYNGSNSLSTFVNGIDVTANGRHYYLTSDSPYPEHKNYLTETLACCGVSPIFLNVNSANPITTIAAFNKAHGGLRCQTNWACRQELSSSPSSTQPTST